VPGLLLQFFGGIFVRVAHLPPILIIPVTLLGAGLLVAGLCYYAKSKGYHPALGLLGLLSLFGLIALAVLPDKLSADPGKGSSESRGRIALAIALAFLGGLCILGCMGLLLVPAIHAAREAARRVAEQQAGGVTTRSASHAAPAGSWSLYQSADSGYQVEIPQPVRESPQIVTNGLTVRPVQSQLSDGQLYQITTTTLPPALAFDAATGFEGGIQAIIQQLQGTITSREDLTVAGGPACEFSFSGSIQGRAVIGRGRIISSSRNLYQLLWFAPQGTAQEGADRFFGSFQLSAPARSPAGAKPSPFDSSSKETQLTLREARQGFTTKVVRTGEPFGAPDSPAGSEFGLIHYESPVGRLAAYLTKDPGDGKKHPAIVWITGGDCNSIGDVWSPNERSNDQSASAFRKAGIAMMFPSQRGGNNNPGRREGFYGEVDDILAATAHLARMPYVDADQIYLGGHSTGGTMVMLVGACSDQYRAIFALGPVASPAQYGGEFVYCDPNDEQEMKLRSPLFWLHSVKSPMYVFEGARDGNWDAIQLMVDENSNPQIQFFKIPGHDHFTVIAPLAEKLANQIVSGQISLTQQTLQDLR
jgi:hypothetical protein